MEDILVKAAQLIVALVLLVTIHEFGHYIFARIFGVKVNRFYLFFNPWFSLLRYNPMEGTLEVLASNKEDGTPKAAMTLKVGKKHTPPADGRSTWRDTIYGLGWVPLGGYCDIAGMVDETKSADKLEAEPQKWELRSKPAWQRLCVMAAGVVLNFVLAIIIYIGIAFHWGDKVLPFEAMTEGMDFIPELQDAGFRNGDRLVSLDGKPLDATDYSVNWDLLQPGAQIGVDRCGKDTVIVIKEDLLKKLVAKGEKFMPMTVRYPVIVKTAVSGEPAAKAGLTEGDRILKVATDTTPTYSEFKSALQAHMGETVDMLVRRNGVDSLFSVSISDAGKVGIQMTMPDEIFEVTNKEYSLLASIPRGWEIGTDRLVSYVSSLKLVFTKEGAQSLGGFGTLGSLFPTQWNWYTFWQMTAFLSVILAFMNVLPIPALDGGYILFLIVEMITRRKPSDKFLEIANTIGLVFLLLLLVYANGNDIYRFFIK